jgi:hypothetical protein
MHSSLWLRHIRTLQQWMGHRDIASTMVYLKGVRNSDIQARINKGSLAAFAFVESRSKAPSLSRNSAVIHEF